MSENLFSKKKIFFNQTIGKKEVKNVIAWAFTSYGAARTAYLVEQLKDLGFHYATKAGISLSVEDLLIPPLKDSLLKTAENEIKSTQNRYLLGEITEVERFQKVIDIWHRTSETLKDEVVDYFKLTDPLNSLYMMSFSGARGNLSQVHQLVGMRGLMADPQGEIIDFPIKSNFKEGLTTTEYLISSYGARKGVVDTALRTADSGYLTRRLVDIAQEVIIREIDCETHNGVILSSLKENGKLLIPLKDRLVGRVLLQNIYHPKTHCLIAQKNESISVLLAEDIVKSGIKEVWVRSPLTCKATRSVCQYCYGWNLAHGRLVELGEAVGIIAAQSIGEPGTQLTMRTFHTGGVFTAEIAKQINAPFPGKIFYQTNMIFREIRTRYGDNAWWVENTAKLRLEGENGKRISFNLTQGSIIRIKDKSWVETDDLLAEIATTTPSNRRAKEKTTRDLRTDIAGEVYFQNLEIDEGGGQVDTAGGSIWILAGDVYNLSANFDVILKNGDFIINGSVLARTQFISRYGGIVKIIDETLNVEVIPASLHIQNATISLEKTDQIDKYCLKFENNDSFELKIQNNTQLKNGQVIAERYLTTEMGGIIRYAGLDGKINKIGYEIQKPGSLLWIPEETHEVNTEFKTVLVKNGQYIPAGTQLLKNKKIKNQHSGIVELVHKKNFIMEIIIKPGIVLKVKNNVSFSKKMKRFIQPGEYLFSKFVVEDLRYLDYLLTPTGPILLLRPVVEYKVESPKTIITDKKNIISIISSQYILYKDGERIKSVQGIELFKIQLKLQIKKHFKYLPIKINFIPSKTNSLDFELEFLMIEAILPKNDKYFDSTTLLPLATAQIKILVKNNQLVKKGELIAQIEIISTSQGEIRWLGNNLKQTRRLLLITANQILTIPLKNLEKLLKKTNLNLGNFIRTDQNLIENTRIPHSGQIIEITSTYIRIRISRPYLISARAIIRVVTGDLLQSGESLALLVFERAKTGDIIQGLPRIEELLEARKPKDNSVLSTHPGFINLYYSETIDLKIESLYKLSTVLELQPGVFPIVSKNQFIEAGSSLSEGDVNVHDILDIFFNLYFRSRVNPLSLADAIHLSLQKIQIFLVSEVQSVYQSQGIDISDKHIEIIIKQMTGKVKVEEGGDTTLLPNELIEFQQIEKMNEKFSLTKGQLALYTPILLGITKSSLNTESFISAASFQETTRVLAKAAVEGKIDQLRGLKENVIIGNLIPAGTGFSAYSETTSVLNEDLKSIEVKTSSINSDIQNDTNSNLDDIILNKD
uniref:DNA-directed RNA polymerase n=1 Tax=Cyanophora biloba TaxID=1489483 RepID=A0A2Z4HG40_9EUKA|nr:RNA polymerase beta'' subunit [Cyanophora biloba]AWW13757.1 RNA polymerase beta'' subunit [Cyanophora biloba]